MSLPVCRFYSHNRNCKFGKNCRFLHSSSPRPPPKDIIGEHNGEPVIKSNQLDQPGSTQEPICNTPTERTNHESVVDSESDSLPTDSLVLINNSSHSENATLNYQRSVHTKAPQKVCQYFAKHGRCAFGRNCRFQHLNVSESDPSPQPTTKVLKGREVPPRFQRKNAPGTTSENVEKIVDPKNVNSTLSEATSHQTVSIDAPDITGKPATSSKAPRERQSSGKVCRFFKSGYCKRGSNCVYSHSLSSFKQNPTKGNPDAHNKNDRPENPRAHVKPVVQIKSRAYRPPSLQQIINLSELDANGTEEYRQFDINYLQKRFQDWRSIKEVQVNEGEDFTIDVTFEPSDPDWPYDVKSFELQLTLPGKYPKELMVVTVPADKQELPESVRRHIEVSFAEWLAGRNENYLKVDKAELTVRPFFKWLDRNFEDIMTEALMQLKRELAAKAAGMEFIPAVQLKAKYAAQPAEEENSGSEDDSNSLSDDDDCSDEYLDSEGESDSSAEEEDEPSLSIDAERRGTEIKLRSMQLKQNTSSLLFEKLRLIIQCSRCKNQSELTTARGSVVSISCDKCSHEMLVQYRPSLAHQFSSIIGYLDLDNCQAFDLILQDCVIVVSCLGCSKMTKLNGMMSGQMVDAWCQACNARLKFATESVKFYHLEPSSVDTKNGYVEVVRAKNKKPPKDPAIREGYPLPDFGTCKHYKQSYRWLRFPCCGKAYPCDVCHDKKEDHEMILANRMICGHCCKEQNFSAKNACNSCNQHMTKVHSAHWEGGTGCRNKIAMSKGDQQKYKNMNKTLSNHKKKVQAAGAKKKTTKLRHA